MTYALTEVIADLLGAPVHERSENFMTRCPLHEDRTPSLSISLESGLWLCFSCGEKGNLGHLADLMDSEIDRTEIARRQVGQLLKPQAAQVDLTPMATTYEHVRTRGDIPAVIEEYRWRRALSHEVLDHFRLGLYDSNTMAMPYWDDGRVTGIKLRGADGFKWSVKGSKYGIYNIDEVRGAGIVVLCEGESDVHSLWSYNDSGGRDPAIVVGGVSGAVHDRSQWELWALDLLWAGRVGLAFDADDAGDKGAAVALEVLGDKAVRLRPPEGFDITDTLLKDHELVEELLEELL